MTIDGTSQPVELLLAVTRDGPLTLGAQVETQLRKAIRAGMLRPGTKLPSTRDLARQLGVSRRITVTAYAQLAAEGYLTLRRGARPLVSEAASAAVPVASAELPLPRPLFDFRPSVPDVSTFPRVAWSRALRDALKNLPDADLAYGDPRGVMLLREALTEYLARVRGVAATPEHLIVTCGFTQGFNLICRALALKGTKRIAIENPSNPEPRLIAIRAGLEVVPIDTDDEGIVIDDLDGAKVGAVLLTPAHQHPTGVVLSSSRRAALLDWLRRENAIAIEDDYDAEFRYDRAAIGALQGLDPAHVVYAGSLSKTLAPALRLGWLVVPPSLLNAVSNEKVLADQGTSRIEQHAFADFLTRGELDRHLRRMRTRYRARRDTIVDALADALPEATIRGIAAGLHVTVRLPAGIDEQAIREEARRRRIHFNILADYQHRGGPTQPTLILGYSQLTEPAIRAGILEIAETVRARLSD